MTQQQIRYFLALCSEGTFTDAAAKCGVRQPSLTQAIRRLEREFGGRLFQRKNSNQLTVLGAVLRPIFLQIDEAVESAHRAAVARLPNKPPTSATNVDSDARGIS